MRPDATALELLFEQVGSVGAQHQVTPVPHHEVDGPVVAVPLDDVGHREARVDLAAHEHGPRALQEQVALLGDALHPAMSQPAQHERRGRPEHGRPRGAGQEDGRSQDPGGVDHTRQQERSLAIVHDLFAAWERELPRLSGKSKLAEAIRYAIGRRTVLERFLADGRIEIDSNIVERTIRPHAITRKNALFAGSDGGGKTWATITTMLTTAKLNSVDPHAWLKLTLERLAAGWPNHDIDALMPWNYPTHA